MGMKPEDYGHKGGFSRRHGVITHRAKLLSLQELLINPIYKLKPHHLAVLTAVVTDLERTADPKDRILRSKVNVKPHVFTGLNNRPH